MPTTRSRAAQQQRQQRLLLQLWRQSPSLHRLPPAPSSLPCPPSSGRLRPRKARVGTNRGGLSGEAALTSSIWPACGASQPHLQAGKGGKASPGRRHASANWGGEGSARVVSAAPVSLAEVLEGAVVCEPWQYTLAASGPSGLPAVCGN